MAREVNYHMAVYGNSVFNYKQMFQANPQYEGKYLKDDELVKAFARQQDEYMDLDETWFIQAWFKDMNDDGPNDNQGHIFPSAIPLYEVMGKRQGDIIEFILSDDPEITVRVTCDQSIMPGYSKDKWERDDLAYSQDPFVSEWANVMYRRIHDPYKLDYVKLEEERQLKAKRQSEAMEQFFKDL